MEEKLIVKHGMTEFEKLRREYIRKKDEEALEKVKEAERQKDEWIRDLEECRKVNVAYRIIKFDVKSHWYPDWSTVTLEWLEKEGWPEVRSIVLDEDDGRVFVHFWSANTWWGKLYEILYD